MNLQLFFLSLASVVTGIAAYRFFDKKFLLYLVPPVVFVLGYFFTSAHAVLFFISLLLLQLVSNLSQPEPDTVFRKAVLPGIFSGLIISWNIALLPFLLLPLSAILIPAGKRKPHKILVLAALLPLTIMFTLPLRFYIYYPVKIAGAIPAESTSGNRVHALEWIQNNVKKGSALVIPAEAEMNTASLGNDYRVFSPSLERLDDTTFVTLHHLLDNPVFVMPSAASYSQLPGNQRRVGDINNLKSKIVSLHSIKGNRVLVDYYYSLPRGGPGLVLGTIKEQFHREVPVSDYDVWNKEPGISPAQIAPYMDVISKSGEFEMEFSSTGDGNILTVRNKSASEKGGRNIIIGYITGRKGFPAQVPGGGTVHVVVETQILNHSSQTACTLMIRDRDEAGEWDTRLAPVDIPGRRISIISKKIRPGAARLLCALRFQPQSGEDKLVIRDFKIVVSRKTHEE